MYGVGGGVDFSELEVRGLVGEVASGWCQPLGRKLERGGFRQEHAFPSTITRGLLLFDETQGI